LNKENIEFAKKLNENYDLEILLEKNLNRNNDFLDNINIFNDKLNDKLLLNDLQFEEFSDNFDLLVI
jgi:hypothetical protein